MPPTDAAAGRLVLLFSGHRLDPPRRARPRFPPQAETRARRMIRQAVEAEAAGAKALGIAGGASGGDILFHEVCRKLRIPSEIYLALPRDGYVEASVADAGPGWVARFDRLFGELPVRFLPEGAALPDPPAEEAGSRDLSVWQRSNLWMLAGALEAAREPGRVRLLALWDGETVDTSSGTGHMVETARWHGVRTRLLDARELLARGREP